MIESMPGVPVAWDWADHLAHGFHGGKDYQSTYKPVYAGCAGLMNVVTTLSQVDQKPAAWCSILMPDGRREEWLELAVRTTGRFPIKQGQLIGYSNNRYPHRHGLNLNGDRVPIETFYGPAPSGGGVTPILVGDDMPAVWQRTSDGTLFAQRAPGEPGFVIASLAEWGGWKAAGAVPVPLADGDFAAVVTAVGTAGTFWAIPTTDPNVPRRGQVYHRRTAGGTITPILALAVLQVYQMAGATITYVTSAQMDVILRAGSTVEPGTADPDSPAAIVAAITPLIPTAAENGDAARAAIVK